MGRPPTSRRESSVASPSPVLETAPRANTALTPTAPASSSSLTVSMASCLTSTLPRMPLTSLRTCLSLFKTRKASAEKKVWVTCQGENPADAEGFDSFEYFPKDAGLSETYFPYLNQDDYQSPLVAVQV